MSAPPAVETARFRLTGLERTAGLLRVVGPPLALFVLVVALWDAVVRVGLVSSLVLPLPIEVVEGFWDITAGGLIWDHMWITLYETLVGFVLGSGLAFLIAVGAALWDYFRRTVYPYMISLQVTPRVAIAPLLVAWFGFGVWPKIVMAATICFFPVFINSMTGLMTVDAEALEMFRSMRASKRQVFRKLLLPSALPVTFAGLKTAMTLALIGAIVGEFVSASKGLGLLIERLSFQLAMGSAFAVLVWLTILGLLLFLIMEWLDRVFVYWHHDERLAARTERHRRRAERRDARELART